MDDKSGAIALEFEGEKLLFYPLEQVRLAGKDYLLVADAPDGDGEALILEDVSEQDNEEALYQPVEDEGLLKVLSKMFSEELSEDGVILEEN